MNRLLQQQIEIHLLNYTKSKNLDSFLDAVGKVYDDYDERLSAAEERIKVANKAKDEFLANISHELRTPLNAILGYSEMLFDELNETGDLTVMRDDIQKIHNAGKHLLAMIEEILLLTRIEAGNLEASTSTFLINPFLEEIVLVSQQWIKDKSNRFEVNVAEDIDAIETDEEKLRQILLNLLSNAGKFTDHGTVSLEVYSCKHHGSQHIAFCVKDTGRGISAGNLKNIFEYFSHFEKNVTKLEGGAGIGLATSKKYCELLGGEIMAESASNKGSSFTILLPKIFPRSKIKL